MDQEKTAKSIEYACTQTINNKSINNNAKVQVIQITICQQKRKLVITILYKGTAAATKQTDFLSLRQAKANQTRVKMIQIRQTVVKFALLTKNCDGTH